MKNKYIFYNIKDMPCVKGRAKHTLCKTGCGTDLCCDRLPSAYECKPLCCNEDLINTIKGVSGSSDWQFLTFFRPNDGIGNNFANPSWGASDTALITLAPLAYADSISSPAARTPNPRIISNAVSAISGPDPHPTLSIITTWWGQYIDHTLAITSGGTEDFSFSTAANALEDPNETVFGATIPFTRAKFIPNSSPRQHLTELTSFLDADNVYGKDGPREIALRTMDGTGHLKTSAGNLGPFNTFGLENANESTLSPDQLFLFGDVRGNENVALIAFHVMFVRLHNILADEFVVELPQHAGQDEIIYQQARRKVSGIQQHIIFNEYLPRILGIYNPPEYTGYNPTVNPSILKEFSTVAYRAVGHPSVQSELEIGNGMTTLDLTTAFFNLGYVVTNGIEGIIQGALNQNMKRITTEVVDDLRNTLFGPPSGLMVLDLIAMNIQRGRDLGLPDYNSLRIAYGLAPKATWADVTTNATLQTRLTSVYSTPSDADPFIGGLAEPPVSGGVIGELFARIVREQFIRVRDGDRFWFENDPSLRDEDIEDIKSYTLGKVIELTTGLTVSGSAFDV